jgi:hypothetical protein
MNKKFMISPEAGAVLEMISGVIEKAFENADKRDQRRHDEAMEKISISRIEAEARAEKLKAEAEQIRSRISTTTSFKRPKNA